MAIPFSRIYVLMDVLQNIRIAEFEDYDELLKYVGTLMTVEGVNECRTRFCVTKPPTRDNRMKILVQPQALWKSALPYVDTSLRKKNEQETGRWYKMHQEEKLGIPIEMRNHV